MLLRKNNSDYNHFSILNISVFRTFKDYRTFNTTYEISYERSHQKKPMVSLGAIEMHPHVVVVRGDGK